MAREASPLRRHAVKLAALAAVAVLYGFARLPELPAGERRELAAQFAFTRTALPLPAGERRAVRPVHPALEAISGWISSVGAGLALTDLDGDGLANDLCYVDNGTDSVVVAPVPGTGERFAAFTLDPQPLTYEAATMAPMGCLPGDLNEDGVTDLLAYYWGRPPIAFLQRSPGAPAPGHFRPLEVVPSFEPWYSNAATRADFDGDGHVDLAIGNYFPDGSRILDARAGGREQMQGSMSRADGAGRNRLLLFAGGTPEAGEPSVAFREAEGALPGRAETGWTLAMGAADLDGDLLPELYVGNDFGPDVLLHNRSTPGNPRFAPVFGVKRLTTPNSKVLGHDSFKGMGVDFADVNGDGRLDIYVSNIASPWSLQESHFVWMSRGPAERLKEGRAPYVDESEPLGLSRSGWSWDCRFADFNNDGVVEAVQATGFLRGRVNRWPELHQVAMGNDNLLRFPASWPRLRPGDELSGEQANPFFVRSASGRYYDLSRELGIDHPMVTRAIALADVDGDADLDFAYGNQWEQSFFYRNDGPAPGRGLSLALSLPVGEDGRRTLPAIGASATVVLPDGRRLVGQVDGGSGHSGKKSPELHFGLGRLPAAATVAVEVEFRDRSGAVRRERHQLEPGRHTLVLGKDGRSDA